jgi:hypothetical protein
MTACRSGNSQFDGRHTAHEVASGLYRARIRRRHQQSARAAVKRSHLALRQAALGHADVATTMIYTCFASAAALCAARWMRWDCSIDGASPCGLGRLEAVVRQRPLTAALACPRTRVEGLFPLQR